MIIKRLVDAASRFDLPPPYYAPNSIRWMYQLDHEGRCHGVIDTRSEETRSRGLREPAPHVQRTSGIKPKLLADKADYALGVLPNDATERKEKRVRECHKQFVDLVEACANTTLLTSVTAVHRFLMSEKIKETLPKDITPSDVVSFQVNGEHVIQHPAVQAFWAEHMAQEEEGRSDVAPEPCLSCGQQRPIADRIPIATKGVPGTQPSGAKIVSANEDAFESYGREASLISPLCWPCARAHAQTLNHMLTNDRHHLRLGSRTVALFWTQRETGYSPLTVLSQPTEEDVRALLVSPFRGQKAAEPHDSYVLILSGNSGRIAIRHWLETSIFTTVECLKTYFSAQAIVGERGERPRPLSIMALLFSLAPENADQPWQHVSPGTVSGLVLAALAGRPLPYQMLQAAVNRNRASQNVNRQRAALVKMVLTLQTTADGRDENMTEELDMRNTNPAYLCGRLFAVIEGIQKEAIPNLNTTVRDKFFGTASTAPGSVFGNLLKGAQSHLSRLRRQDAKRGAYHALQQRLEEIMDPIPEFPATLSLREQALFSLGFYHQRAADRKARLTRARGRAQQDDDT